MFSHRLHRFPRPTQTVKQDNDFPFVRFDGTRLKLLRKFRDAGLFAAPCLSHVCIVEQSKVVGVSVLLNPPATLNMNIRPELYSAKRRRFQVEVGR